MNLHKDSYQAIGFHVNLLSGLGVFGFHNDSANDSIERKWLPGTLVIPSLFIQSLVFFFFSDMKLVNDSSKATTSFIA